MLCTAFWSLVTFRIETSNFEIVYWMKYFDKKIASFTSHYENTPMQYTAILHGCKNDNFQFNFSLRQF